MMIMTFSQDQILEYLLRGWHLSKKQIRGHHYGYLQKYNRPSIYLGKWTSIYTDLKKLQTKDTIEDPNPEEYSIEITEKLSVVCPSKSIRMNPPAHPIKQKAIFSEKEKILTELDFLAINRVPTYNCSLAEGSPNPLVPPPSPIKDEILESLPTPPPIASTPLNNAPIQNQGPTAPSAKETAPSGNPDLAALALLSVVPAVGVTGFVVRNWEAIDKGGKELLKNIDKWGKDRLKNLTTWWNGLFPH